MQFEFATAPRIIFGAGQLRQLGALAREFGRRALVVTGRDRRRAEPMMSLLREQGIAALTFSVPSEPTFGTIEEGVRFAKQEHCEFVIGFGGGSALDTGKAVAAMLTNEGELLDYLTGKGYRLVRVDELLGRR